MKKSIFKLHYYAQKHNFINGCYCMWDKILVSIVFICIVGYVYYRLFLIIIIKNNILDNGKRCDIDKCNCYASSMRGDAE